MPATAIAMTDIETRNWKHYTTYISRVIHGVMQEMGYSEEQIAQYFKLSGDMIVTKTHGKKSVGGINRMVMDVQYFDKKLEKNTKYQWELSEYLNRDICQPVLCGLFRNLLRKLCPADDLQASDKEQRRVLACI